MRLALVIEHLDPAGGGAERNCVELARALARRGHRITLLCAGAAPETEAALPGVTIERAGIGKPRTALRLRRFHRWVDARLTAEGFDASLGFATSAPADVLQPLGGSVHETQARNVAMRADSAARWLKRLLLCVTPKQVMLRRLEKRTLAHPRVKAIAALSEYVRRQFTALGVPGGVIHVIPNAVELSPPAPAQRKQWRKSIRRGFQVSDEATAYLFAAYNPRLKGVEPLLAALARLVEEGTDAVLLLAGGVGFPEQQLAAKLGVRDRVRFIGRTEHMPALYAAADVTVHPTFYDPSSRIVIESLISGTPAITTRYNGAADFLGAGDLAAGRVVDDPADIAPLADAMKALADPRERKRCRDAIKDAGRTLTLQRHVDKIELLLKRVSLGPRDGDSPMMSAGGESGMGLFGRTNAVAVADPRELVRELATRDRSRMMVLKDDPARSAVYRVEHGGATWALKVYRRQSWWKMRLRMSPAWRELRLARRTARVRGLRVNVPLGVITLPRREQALVLPYVVGEPMHHLVRTCGDRALRLRLAAAVGRQTRIMLDGGLANRDHKLSNLIADARCMEYGDVPVMIDPLGVRSRRRESQVVQTWATLLRTTLGEGQVSVREGLTCLKAGTGNTQRARAILAAVEAASRRLA